MSAAYDSFDYPGYWIGREYEHKSEIIAIRAFLSKIKKIKIVLEIGAGFGRLVKVYSFRAKKIILTDPSGRTLKVARQTFNIKKNFKFIHSSVENLPSKIRNSTIDLIIMVRVLHHLTNIDEAFRIMNKMLKPGGYLILEFANKKHIKATLRNLLKGNWSYVQNVETLDIRSKKSIKKGTLPFMNYHPEKIKAVLSQFGFEVIEKRSVSNIRSSLLKKIFATELLVFFEKFFQIPFSYFDIGPSIFVLARKRG